MVVVMERMTIKNFILTLMSVSKAITYLKPNTFIDRFVLGVFKHLWFIINNNIRIEEV